MTTASTSSTETRPRRVFLSHSTKDRADIGTLRDALIAHGVNAFEDVLELRLGDSLAELERAIQAADAFVLLLTPASIGSDWVQREMRWAFAAKSARPEYEVLPILRGLEQGVLNLVGAGDLVPIELGPTDPIESVLPAILQALGLSPVLPRSRDAAPVSVPAVAELTLELTRPRMVLRDGMRRAVAEARAVFAPPVKGREVKGPFIEFTAPLGAIEADDLRWYLEEFPLWPYGARRDRADKVERTLPEWGKRLFDAALGTTGQAEALRAFRDAGRAERRITIEVDDLSPTPQVGSPTAGTEVERKEACARLLALPWELLHDGTGYLFEGARGARVRRRLPSAQAVSEAPPSGLPLRVLYVLSRPEEEGVGFLDPRASLSPLAAVLATLGHAVELTVLSDGSFQALVDALEEAHRAKQPYHVVHFDGHGVYDPVKGLGALVFEDEEDARTGALTRRAKRIDADRIGATLRDHRVPLFVLEACQTAKTDEQPHASVAAALLRAGVASVVAMSHSVLVSTAARFVEAFYGGLVEGQRIGTAMGMAQRALRLNRTRRERDDGSRLELDDWLVPVLFQEGDADPQLVPGGADESPAAKAARQRRSEEAQGHLPPPPKHRFVGRGRELLAVDRSLLCAPEGGRLLAIVGSGGLGKTALVVEAARWLLSIGRVERVAFASVEEVSDARGVIGALGEQLVPGYVIANAESDGREEEKLHNALLPIEKALWRVPSLIVIDNLESVLPAPGTAPSDDVRALFGALVRLAKAGETRVVLTSRESVPASVTAGLRGVEGGVSGGARGAGATGAGGATRELRLGALGRMEAVELLGAVLRQRGRAPAGEAAKEQVEALVEAVGGHARSLVLLGGEVAVRGVARTVDEVRELMRGLERAHPGKSDEEKRELSVIASVKLSLRRLPEGVQRQIRPLAVLRGAAHYVAISDVLEIEPEAALEVCGQLVGVGVAEAEGPYLIPDPALAEALAEELPAEERAAAEGRWLEAVEGFVEFLYRQQYTDAHFAAQGTRTTLADLLAVMEKRVAQVEAGERVAADAMGLVTNLEQLVSSLGMPRVLRRISAARKALTARLPAWGHARFNAESEEVDRKLGAGDLQGALKAALALRESAEAAGEAYPGAAYDRAMAWWQLGRVLGMGGAAEQALGVLCEAEKRFGELAATGDKVAARMESVSLTEQGGALRALGRLDEAAGVYEKSIEKAETLRDQRQAAVGRGQLGTVRMLQGKLGEALAAYTQARETFEKLGEPASVAVAWHQIGNVRQEAEQFDAAEAAYRSSLALHVAQGHRAGEAATLQQLGILYQLRDRLDEAVTYYRQAAELYRSLGDKPHEGGVWNNLGVALHELRRFGEAREALRNALSLIQDLGHAAEPWKTWFVLADVERDAGQPAAAAEARLQARTTYSAYRADGGEPMDSGTRLIAAFGQTLRTQGPEAARALLADIDFPPELASLQRALEALAAGERDPALTAAPDLHALAAVELALVLESLAPAA